MALTKSSELVTFDADEATALARDLAGDDLLVATEYTPDSFRVLYLSDALVDAWGNVDEIMDVGEAVHAFMHDDFAEREFYDDVYPTVSDTYAFASFTDRMVIVRVVTDDEGMYLHVAPETGITTLVERLEDVIASTREK